MIQRIKEFALMLPNVTQKVDVCGDVEFQYDGKKAFLRITANNTFVQFKMLKPNTDSQYFRHVIIRRLNWFELSLADHKEWELYRNSIIQAYQFVQLGVIRKRRVRYAATIGLFDGVHKGHAFLLRNLIECAKKEELRTMVITFDCAPKAVLRPDAAVSPLLSLREKIDKLYETGVDEVHVIHVTTDFLGMPARTFMHEYLVKQLNVVMLLLGHDHVFGSDRPQDKKYYDALGIKLGVEVLHCQPYLEDEKRVSSSMIRELLLAGQIEDAARLLGGPYRLRGKVIPGRQLGRTYGFPTANIQLCEKLLLPKQGVYAAFVYYKGTRYKAMLNIGNCPTVFKHEKTIEVHIFDFDQMIYDEELQIELLHYLREEIRFNSLDELSARLQLDCEQALAVLAKRCDC